MKEPIPASARLARAFTFASLFSCLSAGSLLAVSDTWLSTTTGGNWSTLANWTNGVANNYYPNASGDAALFSTSTTGVKTVTLDTNVTLGSLSLASTATTGSRGWTIAGPGTLTLAGSTVPTISGSDTGATMTISANIAGSQGFTVNTSSLRLHLSGTSTYTGVTTLAQGYMYLDSAAGLGASGAGNETVISQASGQYPQFHIGTSTVPTSNNLSIAENFTLAMNWYSTANTGVQVGGQLLYNDVANTTLTGAIVLDRKAGTNGGMVHLMGIQTGAASTLTISGPVSGSATGGQANGQWADPTRLQLRTAAATADGNINITGTISNGTLTTGGLSVYTSSDSKGVVRLSGANTYTGSTAVSTGKFLINNTTGSGTGLGSVKVSSGALFGGTGIVAPSGTTTVNSVATANGVTFSSGAIVAPGDLTTAGAAIAAGENLAFDLSATDGKVTFESGAIISIDLNALSSTVAESFVFTGLTADSGLVPATADVVFNGNTVNFSVSATALQDGLYTLATFDANNAYSGNWVLGTGLSAYVDAGKTPQLIFNANSIQLQIGAIPEPSAFAMLGGFVALGFAAVGRRRRK